MATLNQSIPKQALSVLELIASNPQASVLVVLGDPGVLGDPEVLRAQKVRRKGFYEEEQGLW